MVNLEHLSPQAPAPTLEKLAVLSLDAAIELDQLRSGRKFRKEAIDALIERIGLRADGAGSEHILQSLIDPATVNIYSRAVTQLTNVPASTINELAREVSKYVEKFNRDINSIGSDEIVTMRDFCLALHHELLAEIYDRHSEILGDAA
ncbi:MAG: hypothetical protein ACRED7_08890 [Stellaceae bacterium]